MIKLTRLDGTELFLNADQIEIIEEVHDTHITLLNGNRYLVREQAVQITEKIVSYRASIIRRACSNPGKKYLKRLLRKNYSPANRQE